MATSNTPTQAGSAWEADQADGIEEVNVLAHLNVDVRVYPGEDATAKVEAFIHAAVEAARVKLGDDVQIDVTLIEAI